MMQWFAAHTQARAEGKALAHLRRQGFTAYLPQYLKRRRHARRIDWIPSPLFPRYLFIRMDLGACRWRAVRSTIGMSGLVCQGERPVAVPPDVVDELRAREDDKGFVELNPVSELAPGAPVRIDRGPFADLVGRFAGLTDHERVIVLLNLLGRQVRAKVPQDAVSGCA